MARTPPKGREAIDFKAIASAALSRAELLLREWLPDGVLEGREWSARNPTRGDTKRGSFKVNVDTGRWADFAADAQGGDLISLLAYLTGVEQIEAARTLAADVGVSITEFATHAQPEKPAKEDEPAEWVYLPADTANAPPVPQAHVARGKPARTWTYKAQDGRVLGYVCRFETSDGGKDVLPLTLWRRLATGEYKWRWAQFPEPRPLYGLERMPGREELPVLLVEGEKCADAAHHSIGDRCVVLTWPGGGKAIGKADFSPIAKRKVVTWADCDAQVAKTQAMADKFGIEVGDTLPEAEQPGVKTMDRLAKILAGHGCTVRAVVIPKPGTVADGWDVADAIASGWDARQVWEALRQSVPVAGGSDDGARAGRTYPDLEKLDQAPDISVVRDWKLQLLFTDNPPFKLLDARENVYVFFKHHPTLKGLVAFDVFAQRVVLTRPPPWPRSGPMVWGDHDDARAAFWLSQGPELRVRSLPTIKEGVMMAARENEVHPVRDYLTALTWDGTTRLGHWLCDFLGVEDTPYTRAVARFSIIAMIARVMRPGCHCRAVLVLLGPQNIGKSKVVAALADPWGADTPFRVSDKDTFQLIQGAWAYEISELDSFSRADQDAVKAFISSPRDRFRPPYAREVQDIPRQVVFMATANKLSFIQDATGGTRYWPVMCKHVDIEGLRGVRDQLMAEALAEFNQGALWWPEESDLVETFTDHQEMHQLPDLWLRVVANWLEDPDKRPPWVAHKGRLVQSVDPTDVVLKALGFEASKISSTRQEVKRVEQILIDLGFEKVRSGRTVAGKRPYVYIRWRDEDTSDNGGNVPI